MLRKVCLFACLTAFGCTTNNKPVDPVVPIPTPAPVKADVVTVNFDFNSVLLTVAEKEKIKTALKDKASNTPVSIVGFTDSQGNVKYNLKLSKKRAKKIYKYLKSLKMKGEVTFEGKGETHLLNADKTVKEHKANRRAEVTFLLQETLEVKKVEKAAEKKVEKKAEKKVVKKVKKVEKKVEAKVEKKVEAKVEKKVEAKVEAEKKVEVKK